MYPKRLHLAETHSSLLPDQKRLVDDWFARLSVAIKRPVDPAEGYENIPLSAKTTFGAVTHALIMTKLTDAAGKELAKSAIDVVDKLDTVAGEILGAGGDEQFRIYVQPRSGVLELLNQSKEFKRSSDNTVYHHGYPISFRSVGTPSIQISLTRNLDRADIDVDYRSSRFPKALLNGHLSASNSDVRAGNNDEKHNMEWTGLQNWWRSLLGLPFAKDGPSGPSQAIIEQEPRRKAEKPEDAIFDFLNTWLVEQKPNESLAYFTDESLPCSQPAAGGGFDRGVAKFAILQAMAAANSQIGKITSLGAVSTGVAIRVIACG